jgi:hypothetical protein
MPLIKPTPLVAANRLIDRLLASMLDNVPGASRVCLNGFGDENGLTAIKRLRYKTSNIISRQKRQATLWPPNQPLMEQEAFLPALRAGHCSLIRASDLNAEPARDFLHALDATCALVCPAADLAGDLVGAVFMLWDADDRPPEGEELMALMALGVRVGGQIAAVLDLCDHASAQPAVAFRRMKPPTFPVGTVATARG